MNTSSNSALERVRVREVAGVLRERRQLDSAVDALLLAEFDRAKVDPMAGVNAVHENLGSVYVPIEELADIPQVSRKVFIPREEVRSALAGVAALLAYVGAVAAALGVVASGGSVTLALAAAAGGGAATGGASAMSIRMLGREEGKAPEQAISSGGLILWVRVRSPEQERKAETVLREHGAVAVRVHEIAIEKRPGHLPLGSSKLAPWLGEPLAGVDHSHDPACSPFRLLYRSRWRACDSRGRLGHAAWQT